MDFVYQVWGGTRRALIGSTLLILAGLLVFAMSVATLYQRLDAFEDTASPSSSSATKIEYYLPYPGILPDNPLYKVKAFRDMVALGLTFDPLKKANREVLYADKRIGAAKYLVEGGKIEIGVSTATKAEKYLEKAYVILDGVSKEGKDVKSQLLNLKKSISKHQEILEEINVKVSGSDKSSAEEALKLNKILEQRLNQTWVEAK